MKMRGYGSHEHPTPQVPPHLVKAQQEIAAGKLTPEEYERRELAALHLTGEQKPVR